ncbi:MAG: hypothetical protein ACI9CP_001958 [Cryomorphaceae bacterium]|jgi:hypothetical protein
MEQQLKGAQGQWPQTRRWVLFNKTPFNYLTINLINVCYWPA